MLVSQSVDLSLQLVWLLFFDHLHVPLSDLLHLGQARMRKSVSLEGDVYQGCVLIESLK